MTSTGWQTPPGTERSTFFALFIETTGFYRPLVGVSFGIQYLMSGLNPGPYGMFNLLLHLLNIVLVTTILSRDESIGRFSPAAVISLP